MDKSSDAVQKHYKQAVHNYRFFCEVHSKLPQAFYDWKITVLFYTAIHLLRALLAEREAEIESSHFALRGAINPKNPHAESPVKKHCYNSYVILYNASLEVRYSGFLQPEKRQLHLKRKFDTCRKALQSVDAYMKSQGYKSLIPIQKEFDFED